MMFYECYIGVIEHSSVNVCLMLNNILRRKLCDLSECSQLEEHSTNIQRTHLTMFNEHPQNISLYGNYVTRLNVLRMFPVRRTFY